MSSLSRHAFVWFTMMALAATAHAQADAKPDVKPDVKPDAKPDATSTTSDDAQPADAKKEKAPKRGDFDAGGRVRLPSGPDEMGQFATFNWIAVDAKARYNLLDTLMVKAVVPLAVHTPDLSAAGIEPHFLGGVNVTFDGKLPKGPFMPKKYEADVRLLLSGAYMRQGAMLLSDKDFPLYVGNFKPGFTAGVSMRVKMSEFVDFSTAPLYVQQATDGDSLMAVQIPLSLILRASSLLTLSADAGVFTGDNVSFSGGDGGRITAGGSITIKIGKLLFHAGAGVASLLTGGMYPTISDSFYVDLNVKWAK